MVEIIWEKAALSDLQQAYEHILEDSFQNAKMVRDDIFNMVEALAQHPERHHLDQFKKDNSGNYRAFEKHGYRVTYKHTDSQVRILRIRHSKQNPLNY